MRFFFSFSMHSIKFPVALRRRVKERNMEGCIQRISSGLANSSCCPTSRIGTLYRWQRLMTSAWKRERKNGGNPRRAAIFLLLLFLLFFFFFLVVCLSVSLFLFFPWQKKRKIIGVVWWLDQPLRTNRVSSIHGWVSQVFRCHNWVFASLVNLKSFSRVADWRGTSLSLNVHAPTDNYIVMEGTLLHRFLQIAPMSALHCV